MDKYIRKALQFENIIIYGAGVIGNQTFIALKELGCQDKVKFFAKSENVLDEYTVHGVMVKSIYDLHEYYKDSLFLIAANDSFAEEIRVVLKKLRVKHIMLAKKVYADSYKKSDLMLKVTSCRSVFYRKSQGYQLFSDNSKTAGHITYLMNGNAGDTVLSWCVRQFLEYSRWNIKEVNWKINDELIREINQVDILIIGGGGLFLPDTNENNISGWQWAISNEQLEQIEVPLVIFSVGYNFFRNQECTEVFKNSLNAVIRKASFVGLRNKGSIDAVKRLVEEDLKDKIQYQPCTTTLLRKIYHIRPKKNSTIVAVNIAFDREEKRFGKQKEHVLHQIAQGIKYLDNKGYQIVFVAHVDADNKFLTYMDELGIKYKKKNFVHSLPKTVINFYKKAFVVIGMRGHAQMIPFGLGVKIITLGTHDKMRWFLEDVNMLDCYIDLNEEQESISEKVVKVFDNIVENAEMMDARLQAEQNKLWEISLSNRTRILNM